MPRSWTPSRRRVEASPGSRAGTGASSGGKGARVGPRGRRRWSRDEDHTPREGMVWPARGTPMTDTPSSSSGKGTSDNIVGRMAGEYRLRRKLGEGAFGAVYEAEHPLLKR